MSTIPRTNKPKFVLPKPIKPIFIKYWRRILLGITALLLVDFCQLFIPRVIKSAIDGLNSNTINAEQLRNHAAVILGLAICVAIFRFFWRYMILGFSRLLEQDLRDLIFHHLLTLDRSFFQRRTTGELMALATNDLTAVQMACGMGLIASIDAIVMTIAAISCMIYINPKLTLFAMAPLPLLAILTRFLAGRLHKRFKEVQEQFSLLTEAARSAITNIRLLKVCNREEDQTRHFDKLGRQYISFSINVAKIQGALFPAAGFIANISLLIIIFFGGRLVITKTISIGDFVAFISYLFMLTWPMMAIGWVANIIQRGLTSLHRIEEILDEKPLLESTAAVQPRSYADDEMQEAPHQIRLSNLSFTYPGQTQQVLANITLSIGHGLFGIVGRTGSGKSTLCQLLARMYNTPVNTVFINNQDINQISLTAYRKNIAYVPQTASLFSDTMAANIAFGKPGADYKEIVAAAKSADIHSEIINFPKQYETRIGEKGIKLSGGQRQRLALARAFLLDTPILLIDDGLAAVDAEAELHIMQKIKIYSQNHIVIMVTHRLAPLVTASSIAVLEKGRLEAIGCHQNLIEQSEIYNEIYNNQNGRN